VDDVQAIRQMLIEAVEGSSSSIKPDYERIAAYHRRPLAVRYADLLGKFTDAADQGTGEPASR
jgi:hypothetical protein